jgi:acyl-CoA reductase-like NAD-dependent aldehyde dehydrogenase
MTDFSDQYLMTIDGKSVGADCQLEAFNPATKEVIALIPDASREQLDEAVESAREAFQV